MTSLRRATPSDMPQVVRLMRELAEFEKLPGPDEAAAARLADDLGRRFDAFVAQREGDVVGYALTYETYSTFLARPLLYLEDLYVTPSARRAGVARALMREVAREARRRGCARVAWAVLDWNADARKFYARLGARETEWVACVLEGAPLAELAG